MSHAEQDVVARASSSHGPYRGALCVRLPESRDTRPGIGVGVHVGQRHAPERRFGACQVPRSSRRPQPQHCISAQDFRVHDALDDVASNIYQALPGRLASRPPWRASTTAP